MRSSIITITLSILIKLIDLTGVDGEATDGMGEVGGMEEEVGTGQADGMEGEEEEKDTATDGTATKIATAAVIVEDMEVEKERAIDRRIEVGDDVVRIQPCRPFG